MRYRPWGPLDWVLSLSSEKQWKFVGTIGTEERSLCSWSHAKRLHILEKETFVEIEDPYSEKYSVRALEATRERKKFFEENGGDLGTVETMSLLSELFRIQGFASKTISPSVILDITSFPKRFFFTILKALVLDQSVLNLIVTYTSPAAYAPDNEPLYEDMEDWYELPGFGGNATTVDEKEIWIVSIGFLVESLRKYVLDNPAIKMRFLIPFPAPLSALRRTWESVYKLEQAYPSSERIEKFRVDTLDMSVAFDQIRSFAKDSDSKLIFAPLGPKPTSAAMCLYAIQDDCSVHYPQPTVYHPQYSMGIRNNDSNTAISAYWVKHDGENLYSL